MATITLRDVQEIVSNLSSDKAKTYKEGIKLLNTWLEGERSIHFVRYIRQKTAMLKPREICHSESWPFLITLLTKCVTLEIFSSKRRLPKLIFAKTFRIVVQQVENSSLSGRNLHLVSAAKLLFNHIWDVLMDVPAFSMSTGLSSAIFW
ncbi:serine/threonine-protein kinase ATM-like [Rhododendron vialii]|uniref:serine/threonine-protein kinase ATM-like n=1 Tax=Rhododendron vialii TaxID=182163 RepID=UPI00265F5810|nr:serine/threonine-protein kinase ATM-like [Rhododendron vialii]